MSGIFMAVPNSRLEWSSREQIPVERSSHEKGRTSTMPEEQSPEEIARLGDEIYERQVKAAVEADHQGRVVAIDVETKAYALGDNARDAARKLLSRIPDAKIWSVRIGHRALYRIGAYPSSRRV